MISSSASPRLSVVVALISGRVEALTRCLDALTRQEDAPLLEILVPVDNGAAEVMSVAERYPAVHFFPLEGIDTQAFRAGASREHHDRLRTLGLQRSSGEYVALIEDHAVPEPRWCARLVDLLDQRPEVAAIGGAVECGSDRLLHWAVYYCDFGRYQNPLPEGPAEYVSDTNVVYRRAALEAVHDSWADDYHETLVHWALVGAGYEIWLTPSVQVWQRRRGLTFREALHERYVWGRSFAGTRVSGASPARRLVYACFCALLPALMVGRLLRGALARRRHLDRFLLALPAIVLLSTVWAWGELVGYATGRSTSALAAAS